MAFPITKNMELAAKALGKEPQIVLEIEGVPTLYGTLQILKYIRIGDPDLYIDGTWKIGGTRGIEDQAALISIESGTTTKIDQVLDHDKGRGNSIQSMGINLVDKNGQITELISPGFIVEDLLGRKCKVWRGFKNTAWKEDYIIMLRGVVDDIVAGAGNVQINIASSDLKRKSDIFQKIETTLNGAINDSVTTIPLQNTTGMLLPMDTFSTYVRIDDEVIQYTGISGNDLTGCTRGAFFTIPSAHDDEATVETIYQLTGDAMTLALKIMLSGWGGPFIEDQPCSNFQVVSPSLTVPNAIFFQNIDVELEYGLTIGDLATGTGATNGANNFSNQEITAVEKVDGGSYIVIDGVTFVDEIDSPALLDFRSQYDVLPDGCKMSPDEVDVSQHLELFRLFLSDFQYDFRLHDTIDAKEFLELQVYKPASANSIPRKGRSSVNYHIGPIPSGDTIILDNRNIRKGDKLKIRRTTTKNFFNTIVYRYQPDILDPDRFLRGHIEFSATSLQRVKRGRVPLLIEAMGLRDENNGLSLATSAAQRRLKRYQFGAEFLEKVPLMLNTGFNVEISDVVIFDGTDLKVSDTTTGERGLVPRLVEVTNKSEDWKTGDVQVDLTDTNFSTSARYCLIGPSSPIKSASSASTFVIKPSGLFSRFGVNEGKKWDRYTSTVVRVRTPDYATYSDSIIRSVIGNTVTLDTPLSFTPSPEDIMELAPYTNQTDEIKLKYGHMRDTAFPDGRPQYSMI